MIFRDHTLLFFHQAVNMFSVIELCFLRRGSVGTDCLRNNIFFLPLLRRLNFFSPGGCRVVQTDFRASWNNLIHHSFEWGHSIEAVEVQTQRALAKGNTRFFTQKLKKRGSTITVKSNIIWLGAAPANQMFTFLVDYCNLDTVFLLFCLVEENMMLWFARAVKTVFIMF